ncbi:hypothetical protein [Pectinatus cerevisiiphilus]|uniref:hypothetical protein n=1 Tax=Pectinatus cerevisiiphilus TaxID=86956 RepID=UPI0018C54AB9|nr:hypothetical protein [Pectinatus cerevisiiphilus]
MAGNSWTKHKLGKETNAKKQTYKLKRKGDILEETSEYINLPEAFRCEEGQSTDKVDGWLWEVTS